MIFIYRERDIYGESPCSANLPSNLTCMDFAKHIQNHCKTYWNAIPLIHGSHPGSISRT